MKATALPQRGKIDDLKIGLAIWICAGHREVLEIRPETDHTLIKVERIPWWIRIEDGDELWINNPELVPPSLPKEQEEQENDEEVQPPESGDSPA